MSVRRPGWLRGQAARRVSFALLLILAALTGSGLARARQPETRSDPYLLLIVLDGFRPDYMRLAPMRHLHALMREGISYNRAWVGQLETETPTGHATIATGVYPRKHGVIGFGWRDPSSGGFTWMPTDLRQLNTGGMERLIEASGVPTLSDLLHRQNPAAKSASLSGEKYYASDAMGTGADYILYGKRLVPSAGQAPGVDRRGWMQATAIGTHVPPPQTHYADLRTTQPPFADVQDQFAAHLAVRLVQTVRPRMLLVNMPGTDIEGHITGGVIDPRDMGHIARSVDGAIGLILRAYADAGLLAHTVVAVTADHGMLPSSHIVPRKAMYSAVRQSGIPAVEDDFLSTAGYIYLRQPDASARLANQLDAHHYQGVEGALYRTSGGTTFRPTEVLNRSLPANLVHAYVDLSQTIASPSGPDVILPYAEDTMGLTVPGNQHWGNHGGLSWRVQHIPLVIAGPGVRHGASDFPAQLVDIAPTLERLLGLPVPKDVDGVVLGDALVAASPEERAAQTGQTSQRARDVQALIAHSVQERGSVIMAHR